MNKSYSLTFDNIYQNVTQIGLAFLEIPKKKFELNWSNLQVADSVEDALEDGHAL